MGSKINQNGYSKYANDFLYYALNIGEKMLMSGAEISRVEDTISRICSVYGAERVDVFTITSSIVVTIYAKDFGAVTQTRRIKELKYNLHMLELLNNLSRRICNEKPKFPDIEEELTRIENSPQYSFPIHLGVFAFESGSFSLFFGGTILDAIAAALIGIVIKSVETALKKRKINVFFIALFCSSVGGILALLLVQLKLGQNVDKISIGNIMLLIPGITLTNSIRDMFAGDTISGLLRFSEAILLSVTIAFGFVIIATVCI